jgi:hypothetical protein
MVTGRREKETLTRRLGELDGRYPSSRRPAHLDPGKPVSFPVAFTEGANVSGLFLRDFGQSQQRLVFTGIVKCTVKDEQYLTN